MKVVVCLAESFERHRVTSLVEQHGDEVLAETHAAFEASEVAERFHADALIVDAAVRTELGQDVLGDLERPDRSYFSIVVSDLASEIEVRWPRAVVVDHHDDHALVAALDRLADPRGSERRQVRPTAVPAAMARVDTDEAFYTALQAAGPGDAIIALSVDGFEQLEALAEVCRRAIRRDDHLIVRSREVVVLLGAGEAAAVPALARIRAAWTGPGRLLAEARTLAEDAVPGEVFRQAVQSLDGQRETVSG